jgi:hypothetical protein
MNKHRTTATFLQFETALLEEIRHQRQTNVPVNALSSAAAFALLVASRLYGRDRKLSSIFKAEYVDLVAEARRVREEAERMAQEELRRQRAQAEESRSRLIIPGQN